MKQVRLGTTIWDLISSFPVNNSTTVLNGSSLFGRVCGCLFICLRAFVCFCFYFYFILFHFMSAVVIGLYFTLVYVIFLLLCQWLFWSGILNYFLYHNDYQHTAPLWCSCVKAINGNLPKYVICLKTSLSFFLYL